MSAPARRVVQGCRCRSRPALRSSPDGRTMAACDPATGWTMTRCRRCWQQGSERGGRSRSGAPCSTPTGRYARSSSPTLLACAIGADPTLDPAAVAANYEAALALPEEVVRAPAFGRRPSRSLTTPTSRRSCSLTSDGVQAPHALSEADLERVGKRAGDRVATRITAAATSSGRSRLRIDRTRVGPGHRAAKVSNNDAGGLPRPGLSRTLRIALRRPTSSTRSSTQSRPAAAGSSSTTPEVRHGSLSDARYPLRGAGSDYHQGLRADP
jgi:hypothetical protein